MREVFSELLSRNLTNLSYRAALLLLRATQHCDSIRRQAMGRVTCVPVDREGDSFFLCVLVRKSTLIVSCASESAKTMSKVVIIRSTYKIENKPSTRWN